MCSGQPRKAYNKLSRVVNPGWTDAETERVANQSGNRKRGLPKEYVTANTSFVSGTPQHTVLTKCDLELFPKQL